MLAHALKSRYKAANPFPHMAIDWLFRRDALKQVAAELPEKMDSKTGCVVGLHRWQCYNKPGHEFRKSFISQARHMGPATKRLLAFLRSQNFVSFLERLSGVKGLMPDPMFEGAGLHMTGRGGHLQVHADFNQHLKHRLHRRVNTFIYLNDDWPEEYGGHLELWNRAMTQCEQRFLPTFGRFVVFTSTSFSYHGHPQPMDQLPPERMRKSIAYYYYTKTTPPDRDCIGHNCSFEGAARHSTLWQSPRGCKVCQESACKAFP